MNKSVDMDEWVRFCLERNPQVLVYKAIFEMVEDLEFPIESREDLRKQLVKPDSKAEEQDKIIALTEEFFPAYLFPMSSKQNALEKIAETVELVLYKTRVVGTYPPPGLRISTGPNFPEECKEDCHWRHRLVMLDIIGGNPLPGWDAFAATMDALNSLNKCLGRCEPSSGYWVSDRG